MGKKIDKHIWTVMTRQGAREDCLVHRCVYVILLDEFSYDVAFLVVLLCKRILYITKCFDQLTMIYN